MTKTLLLPLQYEDNRPIRDALGQLVSIPQHAGAFVAAVNWHGRLLEGLNATLEHLRTNRAQRPMGSIGYANAVRAVRDVEQLIAEAEKAPKLPAPTEATADELVDEMGRIHDQDTTLLDFANHLLKNYRCFPR